MERTDTNKEYLGTKISRTYQENNNFKSEDAKLRNSEKFSCEGGG